MNNRSQETKNPPYEKIGWSILGPYRKLTAVNAIIIILKTLFGTLSIGAILPAMEVFLNPVEMNSPYTAPFKDILYKFEPNSRILLFCFVMVSLYILKNSFLILEAFVSSYLALKLREYWSSRILERYLYIKFEYILGTKQGLLLNNILREPFNASKAILVVQNGISSALMALSIFILTLFINYQVVLVGVLVIGSVVLVSKSVTHRFFYVLGGKRVALWQSITSEMSENLSSMRIVRAFSMEKYRFTEFMKTIRKLCVINIKLDVTMKLPQVVSESISVLMGVGFIYFYHIFYASPVNAILPQIAFFVLSFGNLLYLAQEVYRNRMGFISELPSLAIVHRLIDDRYERVEQGELSIKRLQSDIEFKTVVFGYVEEERILKGLSLRFPKGETSFLIGDSGSGKSTIVDLLLRFYAPQVGNIQVNGKALQDYKLDEWRNLIGYVTQDVLLLNGTIKDNIQFGKFDATDEEIVQAAEAACAHEFIAQLPLGYDALVGDRGLTLSGGQRQRISIARALVRNPDVLILDEATSALDQKLEQEIFDSILVQLSGKTIICITHRIHSARYADIIYLLENGCVKASGTYDELFGSPPADQEIPPKNLKAFP